MSSQQAFRKRANRANAVSLSNDASVNAVVEDVLDSLKNTSGLTEADVAARCTRLSTQLVDTLYDHVAREKAQLDSSPARPGASNRQGHQVARRENDPDPSPRQPTAPAGPPRKRMRGSLPAKKRRMSFEPPAASAATADDKTEEVNSTTRVVNSTERRSGSRKGDAGGGGAEGVVAPSPVVPADRGNGIAAKLPPARRASVGKARRTSDGKARTQTASRGARGAKKSAARKSSVDVDSSSARAGVEAIVWACVRDTEQQPRNGVSKKHVDRLREVLSSVCESLMPSNLKPEGKKARRELIAVLQTRPILSWEPRDASPEFDDFQGCEVCMLNCKAERIFLAGGDLYDSRIYWPQPCLYSIDSSTVLESGGTRLGVRLLDPRSGPPVQGPSTVEPGLVRAFDRTKRSVRQFWMDGSCSVRCLLYHEFAHFVARVSEAARGIIVEELAKGDIVLDPKSRMREGDASREKQLDMLQEHLVAVVLEDEMFSSKAFRWLETACNIWKHMKVMNRGEHPSGSELYDPTLELVFDDIADADLNISFMSDRTRQQRLI